jgi:hypothetical protein
MAVFHKELMKYCNYMIFKGTVVLFIFFAI